MIVVINMSPPFFFNVKQKANILKAIEIIFFLHEIIFLFSFEGGGGGGIRKGVADIDVK